MCRFVSELKSLGLSLRYSVLQQCSQGQWQNWEKFWIATVKASGAKLFNIAEGGNAPATTSESCRSARLGKKDSAETRMNKSIAAKGIKKSPQHVEKVALANRGRQFSDEHKRKLSIAHKGLKQSRAVVAKRVEKMKLIRQSPEYREKMRAAAFKRWSLVRTLHNLPEVSYAL